MGSAKSRADPERADYRATTGHKRSGVANPASEIGMSGPGKGILDNPDVREISHPEPGVHTPAAPEGSS